MQKKRNHESTFLFFACSQDYAAVRLGLGSTGINCGLVRARLDVLICGEGRCSLLVLDYTRGGVSM